MWRFSYLLCLRVPVISRGRGKIGVLCIHKSLPPTMYWTSEADLSGFIFGNSAEWLFGEQGVEKMTLNVI